MDSKESAEKEVKSLADRLSDHSFECNIKTYRDVKDIIQGKSVRAKLLFVVGAGLPYSGTSSLIRGILNLSEVEPLPSGKLDIYSTAFFKDSVKDDGHFVIFDQENESYGMLLMALAKLLKTRQYVITSLEDSGKLFDDHDVDEYFKNFCVKLQPFLRHLSGEHVKSPLAAISKSQSFINFLDVTVNKAIYECLFIVGSWCRNGFLLSVLDLYYYSCEVLQKPLDLSQEHFCKRKYRKEDISLLKIHSACYFFLSIFEGTFSKQRDQNRALLVCTHIDELSSEEMQSRRKQLNEIFSQCLRQINVSAFSVSEILKISNVQESSKSHKEVLKNLISLIEENFGHNNYVHLKDMFFYSYLKNTGQMFLTREAVNELGTKCDMKDREIEECLQLLHHSCFIFHIHNFVILNLTEFIDGISKLYYVRSDTRATKKLSDIDIGFLSQDLCYHIWGSELYDLYVSILKGVGLIVEVQASSSQFFMPSLRMEYEQENVTGATTSLLVLSDTTTIPFHTQCLFIEIFQHKQPVNILPSQFYNVLKLQLRDDVIVKFLFSEKFIEISVEFTKQGIPEHTRSNVYSVVKTTCACVLNTIRKTKGGTSEKQERIQESGHFHDFHYNFAVCCPKSTLNDRHYIKFQESLKESEYWCDTCEAHAEKHLLNERMLWMTSYCEECTLHPDDILNYTNLVAITETLMTSKSSKLEDLYKLIDDNNQEKNASGVTMGFEQSKKLSDRLFHALYTWHCYNRLASKITLAKFIHEHGYEMEAYKVEPLLKKWIGTKEPTYPITSNQILKIAQWWPAGSAELANILEIEVLKVSNTKLSDEDNCTALLELWSLQNSEGDQRIKFTNLMKIHGYYNMPEDLLR